MINAVEPVDNRRNVIDLAMRFRFLREVQMSVLVFDLQQVFVVITIMWEFNFNLLFSFLRIFLLLGVLLGFFVAESGHISRNNSLGVFASGRIGSGNQTTFSWEHTLGHMVLT